MIIGPHRSISARVLNNIYRIVQCCLVILLAFLFLSAQADEAADRKAIRLEVEQPFGFAEQLLGQDIDVSFDLGANPSISLGDDWTDFLLGVRAFGSRCRVFLGVLERRFNREKGV